MSNYLTRPVVPECADETCLFRGEPLAFIGNGIDVAEGPVPWDFGPRPCFSFNEFGCHWCGAHVKLRSHQFDYDAYQLDRTIRCEWCLDYITNTGREDDHDPEEWADEPSADYYLTAKGPTCELPS